MYSVSADSRGGWNGTHMGISDYRNAQPLSQRERAEAGTPARGEGGLLKFQNSRRFQISRLPLTPRASTLVGPLPRGEGLRGGASDGIGLNFAK